VVSYRHLLDLAEQAAGRAAGFIRAAHRPAAEAWDRKARNDFATEVDREAERLIAEVLLAGAPGSRVMGEELGTTGTMGATGTTAATGAGVTWIVDPLDGTTNFLHGYPAYAVSVAAAVGDTLVAGVVVDVVRNLTYRATAGDGAWCDGRPLRVSTISEPALALMGTGFPFKAPASGRIDEYLRQFRAVLHETSGIRRAGSAALDLAHVAEGRLDGFWEIGLAPWDVAAGVVLVCEAGGLVTDFAGAPLGLEAGDVVAGPPGMHAWLLDVVAKVGAESGRGERGRRG
jgi:myo-inositol-1(or 4)-monophosphatase